MDIAIITKAPTAYPGLMNRTVQVVAIGEKGLPYWEVHNDELTAFAKRCGYTSGAVPEKYLMRIDGFDFKHERDSYELPIANEY